MQHETVVDSAAKTARIAIWNWNNKRKNIYLGRVWPESERAFVWSRELLRVQSPPLHFLAFKRLADWKVYSTRFQSKFPGFDHPKCIFCKCNIARQRGRATTKCKRVNDWKLETVLFHLFLFNSKIFASWRHLQIKISEIVSFSFYCKQLLMTFFIL